MLTFRVLVPERSIRLRGGGYELPSLIRMNQPNSLTSACPKDDRHNTDERTSSHRQGRVVCALLCYVPEAMKAARM
jgi:hypothetical protein